MSVKKLLWGAGTLLVVFLLGYWPQASAASALRAELDAAHRKLQTAELRDMIGQAFLESTAKNYGVAREHSTRFFQRAAEVASATQDTELRALLREAAGKRDAITAGLAEGQGAVQPQLEALARRLYRTAGQ